MTIEVGTLIPEWTVESVSVEKMKTMALLLRDPNPIHWDVASVRRLNLGDRVINQGPTNKAYVINMLVAWLGDPARLRSITVRYRANVYAGEGVVAGGTVTALREEGGERVADCDIWLRKDDGTEAIVGTATVIL
jgi:acyl dehydratase